MICASASELYRAMLQDILQNKCVSQSAFSLVQPGKVFSAAPGRSYELRSVHGNIANARPIDERWAYGNVLHFFTESEHATPLIHLNKHAHRFLDAIGDQYRWIGAYGAIAMPQLREALRKLERDPWTRRACADLHNRRLDTANIPACISFLQLGVDRDGMLALGAVQRSLNLHGVMPYDCILLTNILNWAAWKLRLQPGSLCWMFPGPGSLHTTDVSAPAEGPRGRTLLIQPEILDDRDKCSKLLQELADGAQGVAGSGVPGSAP